MIYFTNFHNGKTIFRLPKIQNWVDDNNPGDMVIPLSVALESKVRV